MNTIGRAQSRRVCIAPLGGRWPRTCVLPTSGMRHTRKACCTQDHRCSAAPSLKQAVLQIQDLAEGRVADSTASQSEPGGVEQKAAASAATLLSSNTSSTEQLVLQHLPWLIRISSQQALTVLKVRALAGHYLVLCQLSFDCICWVCRACHATMLCCLPDHARKLGPKLLRGDQCCCCTAQVQSFSSPLQACMLLLQWVLALLPELSVEVSA